ncbi:MAG: hypothetical protein ACP5NV_00100 [Candidatus Woesearchaeota archaeon]
MYTHNNAYPILTPDTMLPREQIIVNPERELDPLSMAELLNIKRGITYKFIIADTPANRKNIFFKTSYYQMVAYKDGWIFNPELYQVTFVSPNEIGEKHARIYRFGGTEKNEKSITAGYKIDNNVANLMSPDDAEGLVKQVYELINS